MGYLGNEPTTGHFPVQTNLVGPGPTYTLTRAPASAGAIEVSVAGVLQPTTSYSVSGTTLTMAGVTSSIPIFIRYLGETLTLPTIADGVVVEAKIGASAVTTAKIANTAVTLAKLGADAVDGTKIADNAINSEHYTDASIDEAHIANDAVNFATHLKAGTDGELITWDASGNPAAVAVGSSGQVLTSGGTGVAPTFAAAAGGAWNLIGTSVASNSANMTITGLNSTYDTYAICFADILPASAGQNMFFRMGDSSGVDNGGSDYAYHASYIMDSSTAYQPADVNDGSSRIQLLNGPGGSLTGDGIGGILYLHRPGDASMYPMLTGTMVAHVNGQDRTMGAQIWAQRLAVITLDRVHIYFASGNITRGRMTVWGIAHA